MVDPAKLIPVTPAAEYERQTRRAESSLSKVWDLLDDVMDPEVPALSLWDLGVLQDVRQDVSGVVALAKALKGNRALKSANLSDNEIGNEGIAALGDALKYNNQVDVIFENFVNDRYFPIPQHSRLVETDTQQTQ